MRHLFQPNNILMQLFATRQITYDSLEHPKKLESLKRESITGCYKDYHTCGHTGIMMGVLKARWRRRDSLCLSRRRLRTLKSWTMRSSLRAFGVSEVCTKKWRWEPSLPTNVSLRWLLPWRLTIGTSAPIRSSFTVWSGATSCFPTHQESAILNLLWSLTSTLNDE